MKTKLLNGDAYYIDLLHRFTLRDTLIAAGYYIGILLAYYIMGCVLAKSGKYYGVPVSIALMLIPLLICRRRLPDLGLGKRNLRRSLIVSGAVGVLVLLVFTIIPGIVSQAALLPLKQIAANLVYYFVIIALSEEISFRGFIQPRLFPLVKWEWLMILLGGVMFVLMHYPFQMAARGMTVAEYWPQFIGNAPYQFLWHLAFTELYRRYGNIFGSTVLHGCVDMSMGIFG